LTESDRFPSDQAPTEGSPPIHRRANQHQRAASPSRSENAAPPPAAPAAEGAPAAPQPKAPPPTGPPPDLSFDALTDRAKRRLDDRRAPAEALPLGPAETTKGWARGYLGRVADAQRGTFAPVRPADEPSGGPRPDLFGAYDEAHHQAETGAERRVAEICLGVAPDHAVVVTLRRSSGNAALDRLATESFRSAGAGRPVDARMPPSRACYRVEISAYRVPPLPAVSIDLIKGRIIYPLKRITKVTVDLQSVDFGPRDGAPNLRSRP